MNRTAGKAVSWLPVLGLTALLFAMPSSEGAAVRRDGTLTVPHTNQYGGTLAHWQVSGLPAGQKAHLQRRGTPTAAWADVSNSFGIGTTDARGRLEFDFHTPAMNMVYFRVVTKGGQTGQVLFETQLQDAEVTLVEDQPVPGAPLVEGISNGVVTNGESFTFKADTAYLSDPKHKKPVLLGRGATLQHRTISGGTVTWDTVATGTVGRDGIAAFPNLVGGRQLTTGSYRVRLADWTSGGDDIGWFLSFPFAVKAVDRPLNVAAATSTAVSDTRVNLTWRPPTDARRANIVITRSTGSPADFRDFKIAPALPPNQTSYADTTVYGSTHYYYAVYAVSADGIVSRLPATTDVQTPAPPNRGEG